MIWPRGEVAELPTETVMGWAARLDDFPAIQQLMAKKSRPLGDLKQFALALADSAEIARFAEVSPLAARLIAEYLPGRLTLVLPRQQGFSHPYYDHYETIGFRVSDYEPLLNTIRAEGPLLLTSANPRGGAPEVTGGQPTAVWRVDGDRIIVLRVGELEPPEV